MSTDQETSKALKVADMGNGKRAGIIGTAALAFAALVGLLVVGFHGRHIGRNAAALTAPSVGVIKSEAPRSAAAVPPR
jgi:hypothetical protein